MLCCREDRANVPAGPGLTATRMSAWCGMQVVCLFSYVKRDLTGDTCLVLLLCTIASLWMDGVKLERQVIVHQLLTNTFAANLSLIRTIMAAPDTVSATKLVGAGQ